MASDLEPERDLHHSLHMLRVHEALQSPALDRWPSHQDPCGLQLQLISWLWPSHATCPSLLHQLPVVQQQLLSQRTCTSPLVRLSCCWQCSAGTQAVLVASQVKLPSERPVWGVSCRNLLPECLLVGSLICICCSVRRRGTAVDDEVGACSCRKTRVDQEGVDMRHNCTGCLRHKEQQIAGSQSEGGRGSIREMSELLPIAV